MSSSSSESDYTSFKPMRLQRYLSQCGLGSRRDCEEFITAGRVEVDGRITDQLGSTVNPAVQTVTLDGERLKLQRKKYFILNKPSGFLCTSNDPDGRRVVLDLFPDEGPRLFTVGRLDENTTGLLVVTNDGDLAQKLAHPRHRIFRLYKAQVAGNPKPEVFKQLKQGLFFTEGKFRVHAVKPVKKQKGSTWVEITMTEGQNREIRRLFARVGHKIMKLERIGYGPLRLGRVPLGRYRELTRDELAELHSVLERNRKSERLRTPDQAAHPSGSHSSSPRATSQSTSEESSHRRRQSGGRKTPQKSNQPGQQARASNRKGNFTKGSSPQRRSRKKN